MFPFDVEVSDQSLNSELKDPIDYEIDFESGKLTGRIITGLDAVIQWIKIALLTNRYYFPQYSWTHGSDLATLIGQAYDPEYTQTEVKRMISEAISIDPSITGFDDVKIDYDDGKLSIAFTVNTIYGSGDVNV